MNKIIIMFLMPFLFLLCQPAYAAVVTIDSVPSYYWYHGCSPTAAANVLGFWDGMGYSNLFSAEGDDLYLTANVAEQISSSAHNLKYDSTPDDYSLPHPADTSIADFMHTSEGSRIYGQTSLTDVASGIRTYANYRGYSDWTVFNASVTFESLIAEIDAGRPLLGYVSTTGLQANHSVSIIGYDTSGYYGFYDTWNEEEIIRWEPFHYLDETAWGIHSVTFIRPGQPDQLAPVPEPATAMLFALGLICISCTGRRKG